MGFLHRHDSVAQVLRCDDDNFAKDFFTQRVARADYPPISSVAWFERGSDRLHRGGSRFSPSNSAGQDLSWRARFVHKTLTIVRLVADVCEERGLVEQRVTS